MDDLGTNGSATTARRKGDERRPDRPVRGSRGVAGTDETVKNGVIEGDV